MQNINITRRRRVDNLFIQPKMGNGALHSIHQEFEIGETIGSGRYGHVKRAYNHKNHRDVVIKIMKKDLVKKEMIAREVSVIKNIFHDGCIKYLAHFHSPHHYYIVYEYHAGGNVHDWLCKNGAMPERMARRIFSRLVDAVHYLHTRGIIHRDIKTDNIVLTTSDETTCMPILIDFQFAKDLGQGQTCTQRCGTVYYVAPELLSRDSSYSFPVDMWALGVCLYVMLSATMPFCGKSVDKIQVAIKEGKFNMSDGLWTNISLEAKNLINCLLEKNQVKRFTSKQVLSHPWLIDLQNQSTKLYPVQSSPLIPNVLYSSDSLLSSSS